MSKKRTSAESSFDEQTIECSDSVLQQEDNAKRTKLAALSDTTLQDLPIELLEYILINVVTMEVKDAKLVKSVWKEKADIAIGRLGTVCSQWSSILTTNVFRNKVHRILEGTAQETIRLEILQQSSLEIFALEVTTLKDEMFALWVKDYHNYSINVYDRNNMDAVKDVIPLPGRNPLSIAGCSVSNCVYLLDRKKWFEVTVLRITKDDDQQFNLSALISVPWLPNPTLSVTTTGSFILSKQLCGIRAVISIYNANGSLQHEIRLTSEISGLSHIIPKSNGNLVLVSDLYKTKLTEIDLHGTILRQYLPPVTGYFNRSMICSHADIYGRILMIELRSNRFVLLDSELNLLNFSGPQLDACHLFHPYILHYNSERNEIMSSFAATEYGRRVLTILRFTDE